ncbi:hypothetical protein LCGC14_2168920 [marine sediment metagenome]|uniref:Uncharacterized protein n=1 Tax=marine sediment metagenome TaxID=412755 RepID=A0A0F8VCH9_9ZZZZ
MVMERNYERLDHVIGENNLQKIDRAINECEEIALNKVQKEFGKSDKKRLDAMRIGLRKYLMAQMLEMFGTWKKAGDCLPTGIRFGKFSNKYISCIVEEEKEHETKL